MARTKTIDGEEGPMGSTTASARRRATTPRLDVDAVIFDVDNTLVDVLETKRRALARVADRLSGHGIPGAPEDIAAGLYAHALDSWIDRPDLVRSYLQNQHPGVDASAFLSLDTLLPSIEVGTVATYDDTAMVLRSLQTRGIQLFAVTDAPRDRAEGRMKGAGIWTHFTDVVALEDTPNGKRDTGPFRLLLDRHRLDPSRVLAVGDHPVRDVYHPMTLGCLGALATHGERSGFNEVEAPSGPTVTVQRLGELLQLVSGMPSSPP